MYFQPISRSVSIQKWPVYVAASEDLLRRDVAVNNEYLKEAQVQS